MRQKRLSIDSGIVLGHGKIMVFFGFVCQKINYVDRIRIGQIGLGARLFHVWKPGIGQGQHVRIFTKVHGASGAGIDAGRQQTVRDTIETHGAFTRHVRACSRELTMTCGIWSVVNRMD